MKTTVLSIFGTRPEAIKMAPVVKELEKHPGAFNSLVCVTAQHRHMLDQALELFDIRPDYDLDIMKPVKWLFAFLGKDRRGSAGDQSGLTPHCGHTTNSFANSLVACKLI